ncbi:lytic transglycosylase domain-containing protein [Anaeromyxobacter sp. PSR-1]|uniref:lytic transglycosylase domain-containing protein n=1 Tax=Anaeromyxobacter sp. PSR-1 TaxID=1300915 RepID=UPI0005E6095E|nr:lytic transglycosylase domain-containing protein [Anaeromyxobacter sp. PSR-1]GAO04201.1 membrane-bound lytic murein transglycosylase D [Anaeromyxobacter sp. PSR-1]
MRQIRTTFLAVSVLALAGPGSAQGPVSRGATVEAAAQALPAADVPEAQIVAPPKPAQRRQEPSVDDVIANADAPDEPAIAEEIEQESAELEDLRQAEEASRVQDAGEGRRTVGADGLGLESPIRDRVEGALGRDATPRGEGAGRIPLLPEIDHDLATLQAEYDIPIDVNEAVVAYVRFFQSPSVRAHFVKWLGRSHRYMERYRKILKEEGLPEDTVFLAMIESGFGNFAYSRAKASGPWQFIAATGKSYGLKQDFWVDERRDPERSARAAARFLKRLREQTGDWRLAWAGYNAGAGRILAAQKKGYDDFWAMADVPGKKVLRAETKGYVPKLMAAAIITKHHEAFGFRQDEIERQAWTDYEEVDVPDATLLTVIARAAGVSEKEIIDLNPELRRACTPPRPYKIKIPAERAQAFAEAWPALRARTRLTFAGHVVRRGDSIGRIAQRYGVPAQGILEMNGLKNARKLRVGTELIIPRPAAGVAVAARAPEPESRRTAAAERAAPAPVRTASAAAPAAKPAHQTLRVRAGDTLWSIAQRFGVELQDLCRWNGIKNPRSHKLMVGAMIVVRPGRG